MARFARRLSSAFLVALVVGGALAAPAAARATDAERVRLVVKPVSAERARSALEAVGARTVRSVDRLGVHVVEVPAPAVERLTRSGAFAYVEPDGVFESTETIPNDVYWNHQWGPRKTRAPLAWDTTTGDPAVVVAVLDTGVDAAHPDLVGAVVPGTDLVNFDSDPADDNGHGTGVAGIVAARTNNVAGIAAYCWTCQVMPVKVLDHEGSGRLATIAEGIVWAADHGARVINMSLGSPTTYSTLDDAITYARGKGAVVIAAAGNQGVTSLTYPAASPGVIAVAGTDENDARYTWSNYGDWVDVAAPGCHGTTILGAVYGNFCGTSSAAPAAAGIAALALAANPVASGSSVEELLLSSAVAVGSFVVHGRVDAAAAVAAALQLSAPVDGTPSGSEPVASEPATSEPVAPEPAPEPVATTPSEPQDVAASAGDKVATVTWIPPVDDGGDPITGYEITVEPGGTTRSVPESATSAVFDGLKNGTAYAFSVAAVNEVGRGPAATSDPAIPALDAAARVAGTSRVLTAVRVSEKAFTSAGTVVIARADAYADALAAGPLAAEEAAPILLTGSDALAPDVAEEVGRLGATMAILVGGETALSAAVADGLRDAGVTKVERISGTNRFDTAARIALRLGAASVYVVEGANSDPTRGWPDAVAVSGLAAFQQRPVLLVTRDSVPVATADALSALGVDNVTVVGGAAAVSDAVFAGIAETGATVTRLAGGSRYETSALIAQASVAAGAKATRTWLATGRSWPDALTAGPAAAAAGGVLLLVDGDDLAWSPPASEWVGDHAAVLSDLVLVGGTASISAAVENDLEALLP